MAALQATISARAADYTTYEEKVATGLVEATEGVFADEGVPDELGDGGIMPFSSHSISSGYGVGTSNVSIFAGVASKLPYGSHYVYWRDGQYTYRLAYSDTLSLAGSRFSGDDVRVVAYTTNTGTGNQASWVVSDESSFSLTAGNYLVWSDLGDYPQLETGKGERDYVYAACVGLAVLFVFGLLRSITHSIRGRLD